MKKFKLLYSSHRENGKDYEAGEIIETYKDLASIFPDKFEYIGEVSVKPEPEQDEGPEQDTTDEDTGDSEEETEEDSEEWLEHDENVTAEFPEAVSAELSVLRKGAWFYVVDPSNPSKALNSRGIRKEAVAEFITDL